MTVINGKVIHFTNYCKTKAVSTNGVNGISIISNIASINVSVCDTSDDITAHLHGSGTYSNITFMILRVLDQVIIFASRKEDSNCPSKVEIVVNNDAIFRNSDEFTLDISVPQQVFKSLCIHAGNSHIDVAIIAETIKLVSKNGDIRADSTFRHLTAHCNKGDIEVYSQATCDIGLDICSNQGDAKVTIYNIGRCGVILNPADESRPLSGDFTVIGSITAKNGNARFY